MFTLTISIDDPEDIGMIAAIADVLINAGEAKSGISESLNAIEYLLDQLEYYLPAPSEDIRNVDRFLSYLKLWINRKELRLKAEKNREPLTS